MISKLISDLNKKWDNMPEPLCTIVMIVTVIIVVVGVTSKIPIIKWTAIPVLLIFCLIRLSGIAMTKKK